MIVEGATKASGGHYWDGDTSSFTQDGHSTDNTITVIKDIMDERKDKFIALVQNQDPNGFWPGKTAMCNAASMIATGDYIWQIDSDEFYHQIDMEKIIGMLKLWEPHQVDFYANHFVGGFDKVIDETNGKNWGNDIPWRRIFRHVPSRKMPPKSWWISHEPPVYVCDGVRTDAGNVVDKKKTLQAGIKLYHYAYVTESQFQFKEKFYGNPEYMKAWNRYKETGVMEIFGIKPKAFTGKHPKIIKEYYNL
jgi:glycosyltransferase involved in cell wall biosynthesis